MPRYWISFDLGIRGRYEDLCAWLDQLGARECGDSVATFTSKLSREQIGKSLKSVLSGENNPRAYIIEMKRGGKFLLGKRKLAPWSGYAQTFVDSGEER